LLLGGLGPGDPDLRKLGEFLKVQLEGNVFEPAGIGELCAQVTECLSRVIVGEASSFESRPALDLEVEAHDAFGTDRARHFIGREAVLDAIATYLVGEDRRLLLLHGPSGSGKSAAMAKASDQAHDANTSTVIVRRFIGVTPESSNGVSLLRGLCQEIGRAYGGSEEAPLEFTPLASAFADRLTLSTAGRPLVLFLDALDQLAPNDEARSLTWLFAEQEVVGLCWRGAVVEPALHVIRDTNLKAECYAAQNRMNHWFVIERARLCHCPPSTA
jgi:hypothetical protein